MNTIKHDLNKKFSERFSLIIKEYGFQQKIFSGGQFTSSTISEYAKGDKGRGMLVDNFVALLRIAKFRNKFIRDQIIDILEKYYAEVEHDLLLSKPKR